MSPERVTSSGLRKLIRFVLAVTGVLAAITLAVPTANAHGGEESITPADGELLVGTPAEIVIDVPGTGAVNVELVRVSDEAVLPFTGENERGDGIWRGTPPALEPGTYIVRWTWDGGREETSFSVGKRSVAITGDVLDGRGWLGWWGAGMLGMAGALAAGASLHQPNKGRRETRWLMMAGSLLGGAGLALSGAQTTTVVLAGVSLSVFVAAEALRGRLMTRQGLLWAGVVLTGASIGTAWDSGGGWQGAASNAAIGIGIMGLSIIAGWSLSLSAHPDRVGRIKATWPVAAAGVTLGALAPVGAALRNGWSSFSQGGFMWLVAAVGFIGLLLPALGAWVSAEVSGRAVTRSSRTSIVLCGVVALLVLGAGATPVKPSIMSIDSEKTAPLECLLGNNRLQMQRCLDEALVILAEERNVNDALDTLGDLLTKDPKARYFCHEASHAIGRTSLRLNGSLASAFRDGYDVCDFGYYHGIVEGAAGGMDDDAFKAAVPALCGELATGDEIFYMQCNHGIGHAAARRTNNDMNRALSFCEELAKNQDLRERRLEVAENGCGTGVTMEWFAVATSSENASVRPEVNRPRDVCLQVSEKWASDCIEYVGNTLDSSNPVESLVEIGQWCGQTELLQPCYRGLARAASGVGITASEAIAVCESSGDSVIREDCISYYIAVVATTIEFNVKAVERICEQLPAKDREGEFSLCSRVRAAVVEVLAASDGKKN